MRLICVVCLGGLTGAGLFAGVTYDQTMKFTGGSMVEMMRSMSSSPMMQGRGGGMGAGFKDQNFHVYVSGSKMARIGETMSTITDLDAETMTTIYNDRKTYTVETFDQIRERNARFSRGQGDASYDVHVEQTGKTRVVDGLPAKETLITMNAKTNTAAGNIVIKMHAWVVPADPAMKEVAEFSKRLMVKLNSGLAVGGGPAAASMGAALGELQKLDGCAVLTDMEVSGMSMPPMGPMGDSGGDPNKPAMILETQSSNFASAIVDDSKFSAPAGYTQEQRRTGGPRGPRP